MIRTPLVLGNWKMNGSFATVNSWTGTFLRLWSEKRPACESGLCVPAVYVSHLAEIVRHSAAAGFLPGAEDVSLQLKSGPYTGEVSAAMLRDVGTAWCLAGHSERRTLYGETDADVASKVKALADEGIRPVLCVGETYDEHKAGRTEEVVTRQLEAVLKAAGAAALASGAVAYEPVWAIGSGIAAGIDQIEPVHKVIRSVLEQADPEVASSIRILYGGSVKERNAAEILSLPNVDGALVGGASMDAGSFYRICSAAR